MDKNNQIKLNLLTLSWPIFIEQVTGGLVTFVDTIFLSMISDEAASSVGTLGAVLLLGYFIIPQFSSAGTSVSSQFIGAKKDQRVIPAYIGNIIICTLLGVFLSIILFFISPKIGLWFGMTEVQNNFAFQYLEIISFNFILVGLRFSYSSILASKTLTKWNMVVSVVTNVLNILLCWLLMKGIWIFPELGIKGIALATVISYFAGFIILFYIVHIKLKMSFFIKNLIGNVKKVTGAILKIGIPSALEPFSYTIQNFVVSIIIISLGLIAMAANTYVLRLIYLDLTVSWTLTTAGQIIMSHYIGRCEIDKVNKTYYKIILYTIVFAFINILIYLLFTNQILSIFTKNTEIKNTAFWILLICLFMEPVRSINIFGGVALKTAGDGKFSAIMGILFMWGVIPVIIIVSKLGVGIIGLWLCLLADETIRAIINLWRWNSGKWKNKLIIKHDS